MERSLRGKVALVTGAGVRVGRAIAEMLGRGGAHVALHHHRSRQGAEAARTAIVSAGASAELFQADLSASSAMGPLVGAIESALGPIDILVNSAAIFERAPFVDTSINSLDAQWALNARAPYLLTQAVARSMLARGVGDVINVLDIGGALVPWRSYSAYCMTKAALATLTKCLALELAPAIRVNAVAPGTVLPPETLSASELAALRERIPQQRFGSAEDVAQTVQFLLTGPSFVTGQILAVDGGRSLGSAAS